MERVSLKDLANVWTGLTHAYNSRVAEWCTEMLLETVEQGDYLSQSALTDFVQIFLSSSKIMSTLDTKYIWEKDIKIVIVAEFCLKSIVANSCFLSKDQV